MEISIVDIILYQSFPETFQKENPEKFQYVKEFLSIPENRFKFFQTSEELEESVKLQNSDKDSETESEFALFWNSFQKEYLDINPETVDISISSDSFISKWKRKINNLFFPSIVPLFLNLLIYWDRFWNQGNFLKVLLSDEIARDGVFFLQMGQNSYDLFRPVNYGILFFSCSMVFILWIKRDRIKGFLSILMGFSIIFLVLGMLWNAFINIHSASLLPEWIAFMYLFLAILLVRRK